MFTLTPSPLPETYRKKLGAFFFVRDFGTGILKPLAEDKVAKLKAAKKSGDAPYAMAEKVIQIDKETHAQLDEVTRKMKTRGKIAAACGVALLAASAPLTGIVGVAVFGCALASGIIAARETLNGTAASMLKESVSRYAQIAAVNVIAAAPEVFDQTSARAEISRDASLAPIFTRAFEKRSKDYVAGQKPGARFDVPVVIGL